MDIFNTIKERRSIRQFQDKEVERNILDKIIEAATWAPSASNVQGWKFIIVDDEQIKGQLVDLGASIVIKDAPSGILVLYDNRTINLEYMDYIQSASASIQNMVLTSYALGIGSCWICRLPLKRRIRKMFKIPHYFDPIAYIALGYSTNETKLVERKYKLSDLVSYNDFDSSKLRSSFCSSISLSVNRAKRKLYFILKELSCLWKR